MENKIEGRILFMMVKFFVNYIKYFFLTGSVFFPVGVLLFIIVSINPNFSFSFLQYFSFINPIYKADYITMGLGEIMQLFAFISFVFMITMSLVGIVLKKIFKFNLVFRLKMKIIIFFMVITLLYGASFAIVASDDALGNDFYLVLGIFYFANLFFTIIYFFLNALLTKISKSFEKIEIIQEV